MKDAVVLVATAFLAACATQPEEFSASYVSTLEYKDHDCDQLAAESRRVSRKAMALHGNLKKTADNDEAQMAVGLILLWPTLFLLEGGDGPQASGYALLKGRRDAIEEVSISKKCAIEFKPFVPPKEVNKDGEQKEDG